MKNKILYIVFIISMSTQAQIGIHTNNPEATIDIVATNPSNPGSNEGILIPKLNDFPATNPGIHQHSMLTYIDNNLAPKGKGFYYWNNNSGIWNKIGTSIWGAGENASSNPMIFPLRPDIFGMGKVEMAIMDVGFVAIGSQLPQSNELRIEGNRVKSGPSTSPDFIVETTANASAELKLKPGGTGSTYLIEGSNGSPSSNLLFYEDNQEVIEIKDGGDVRVDNLKDIKNAGIEFPADLRVDTDGTVGVSTSYSMLDNLKANAKNFSSVEMCETQVPYGVATTTAFYTYTVTPIQDVLLEMSYRVGATINGYGDIDPPTVEIRHDTKLYGIVIRVNGVDYVTTTDRYVGNDGLRGYFYLSDHMYIPLIADGTTYNITLHGTIKNGAELDADPDNGMRGTFGGDPEDRIQIIEHLD
jgi:hypothetical protein